MRNAVIPLNPPLEKGEVDWVLRKGGGYLSRVRKGGNSFSSLLVEKGTKN
jgi:hypothetical protein